MAGISEKLYPPTISEILPAFYKGNSEDGTETIISVPFSMNKAVNSSDIWGFEIKIKTVQSNKVLSDNISQIEVSDNSIFINKKVEFTVDDAFLNNLVIGQFLKVQLAYVGKGDNEAGTTGYFSTVGIIKYTSKPNIYIKEYFEQESSSNRVDLFASSCTGVYECAEDKTEKPNFYKFTLYDGDTIIETSDWLLHNNINESLDEITDTYTFKKGINLISDCQIEYSVKTINGLEVSSKKYNCINPDSMDFPLFPFDLKAENNFEEGYIQLRFELNDDYTFFNNAQIETPFYIEIYRNGDSFSKKVSFSLIDEDINNNINLYDKILNWRYKDYIIEQGMIYKYCYRQYNKFYHSPAKESNEIMADFEDMFLYDGERQLKIRFNPKVSSFKINRMEQKMETIGSKYPYIFRNGIVEYKEFPISGLVSYHMDENEEFINYQDDLGILSAAAGERTGTPELRDDNPWETTETLNLVHNNMRAERNFKLLLMDWLGNGEVKMFKSPAEGNYLVRLMNISLSPEDRLSRMLHNFSCTAYEIEELSYDNLIKLGLLKENNVVVEDNSGINNIYYILGYSTTSNSFKLLNNNSFKIRSIEIENLIEENSEEDISFIKLTINNGNNIYIEGNNITSSQINLNLLYTKIEVSGYRIKLYYLKEIKI